MTNRSRSAQRRSHFRACPARGFALSNAGLLRRWLAAASTPISLVVLAFVAFLALHGTAAHAAPVTWPARYGEVLDLYEADRQQRPPVFNVATEAEACQAENQNLIRGFRGAFKYCANPNTSYCADSVLKDSDPPVQICTFTAPNGFEVESPGDLGYYINPICGDVPRTAPPPFGSVRVQYVKSLDHTTCTCPEGSTPHMASGGYCILARRIELTASRTTFKPGGASKPVELKVAVYLNDGSGRGAPGEPVELSVIPSGGVPGTLTPTTGFANNGGGFGATYYFPGSFQKARVDTIRATCRGCVEPATVELRMAPIVVGFFNGVWNTDYQASDGLKALKELIGLKYEGTDLRYENFYNQTGTGNGNTALQDIAEVFIQRGNELDGVLNNRWEHYWELLAGKHAEGDSLTARLINGLGNGASALAGLFDATFNAMLGQMFSGYSQMLSNPPTAADVAAQLQKLRGLADEDYSFALIAHSQGNLFVNSAYDGLRGSHPDTKAGVIHVAPASPTQRGEHLLADIDLVINGLRVQGISAVAPININLPASKSDLSGHTLVDTYLDPTRAAREKINGMVQAVLGKL